VTKEMGVHIYANGTDEVLTRDGHPISGVAIRVFDSDTSDSSPTPVGVPLTPSKASNRKKADVLMIPPLTTGRNHP